MHLKVFVKLKKTLKTLSSGQKNPKNPKKPKTQKNPKKPKKTHWAGFFLKKPGSPRRSLVQLLNTEIYRAVSNEHAVQG
jgi:hypothetical protein